MESGSAPDTADRSMHSIKGLKKRLWVDRLATNFVTLGGGVIILAILAILFVIVWEFAPLFKSPKVVLEGTLDTGATRYPLAVGMDEYREVAYRVDGAGIQFFSLKTLKPLPATPLPELFKAGITSVSPSEDGFIILGLSDGRVLPVQVKFENIFSGDTRTVQPKLIPGKAVLIREDGKPVETLTHFKSEEGYSIAVKTNGHEVAVIQVEERRNMMGGVTQNTSKDIISFPVKGEISVLVFHTVENALMAGTTSGQILRADLEDRDSPGAIRNIGKTDRPEVSVTSMDFVLGDYTLVVGDSKGGVSTLQWLKLKDGKPRLHQINNFEPHTEPTTLFSKSLRTKAFLSGAENEIRVHYSTHGETQITLPHPEGQKFKAVSLSRKGDGILAADAHGKIYHWTMNNPYPQITLKSVFGKIWYEGYKEPEYVWQSTGGTDEFESKFSLVPLIFGTLKGTFYAMLFAIPIAILGAFYTSQFMDHRLKGIIKPTIELMAALPSVILGFFAALLIAPEVERFLPGVIMTPFVIAGVVLLAALFYEISDEFKARVKTGREIWVLVPLTLFGGALSFYAGTLVESSFLMGDHRTWLNEVFSVTYDQRNALVVGLAMGFAVIPIIFTITEDSLSNVPEHLKASSLALGATPWQTALQVILPTASPGIFSAIMIGFGRAVGETMIVLMATGNTPVMEWSMFNGFRALSANIAVELPEAPEGGTLFRLLFLAAFLLFVMTFIVNTLAELVRLRLRKRYRVL